MSLRGTSARLARENARRLARLARAVRASPPPELVTITPEDRRYLTAFHDDSVPLPPGATEELTDANPRLRELREKYAALRLPVLTQSRWRTRNVTSFLSLSYFRGDTIYYWHYRELPRITSLKYFVYMKYVREHDPAGLLDRLGEDGAFGCWTYTYPGYGTYSRDLLESTNEICFLERQLHLSDMASFSMLDIGAGYGRLAHRVSAAYPNLGEYCCVDAVPESTFLSEYYLRHRGCAPPARVVSLDQVETALTPGRYDLAVNIHSFSECTHDAIAWWLARLRELEVPRLLIVPNEPTELLSLEPDRTRRDFAPLLEAAGYRLVHREPVIQDPAVQELLRLRDQFHLFERT